MKTWICLVLSFALVTNSYAMEESLGQTVLSGMRGNVQTVDLNGSVPEVIEQIVAGYSETELQAVLGEFSPLEIQKAQTQLARLEGWKASGHTVNGYSLLSLSQDGVMLAGPGNAVFVLLILFAVLGAMAGSSSKKSDRDR